MEMKRLNSAALLLTGLILGLYGCKKEEENSQEIVQQHIIGAWPIKYNIKTTFTDDVETKNDTLTTYNPIDTLVFTADGHAIRRNKTIISDVGYTISADGETLTFAQSSPLKITFVRKTSIGLGTETVTEVGGKKIKIQIADHLIK